MSCVEVQFLSLFFFFSKRAELCLSGLTGGKCGCCKISAFPHGAVNILLAMTADVGPEEPGASGETFPQISQVHLACRSAKEFTEIIYPRSELCSQQFVSLSC